jgi:phosphatidylinositol 4-kinase
VYIVLLLQEGADFVQPASRIQCNVAFGELVANFSDSYISDSIDTVVPVLVDMLGDIPFLRFEKTLAWDGAV